MPIYISGMGIYSAIGNDPASVLDALKNGRTGIGKIHQLETIHKNDYVAGEINFTDSALEELAGTKECRTTLLGLLAARQAVKNAFDDGRLPTRTGFINSTTVGGITRAEKIYKQYFETNIDTPIIGSYLSGEGTQFIAKDLGVSKYVTTISTACSSAANAIITACRLIQSGQLDCVIAGGVDALSKFTFNGFNTLMILDKDWCKPFDNQRKGLNLGEGGAYLVLESEKSLKARHGKPLAIISGYGNANDAYHQTASSPEGIGATNAIKNALNQAGLSPEKIDYINAHGTGTPNNDASECAAMTNVFGNTVPAFSSTKAFTGHTLAASASIEAVISLLSLQNGLIFPSLNISEFMTDTTCRPVVALQEGKNLQHVMSNSFGFGGNCASLIFSKI